MNKDGILRYLRALSATNVSTHGRWVIASCPLAPWEHTRGTDSHPSFAVEIADERESRYNCFSCGGGDLTSLLFKLRHRGAGPPKYDLKAATEVAMADGDHPVVFNVKEWGERAKDLDEYVTFPELWLATFMPATQSPRAMKYLQGKRRVSLDTVRDLDLRYDTDLDAICFPIRDFDNVLCGLRGRRLAPTEEQPRYHMYGNHAGQRNKSVWYGESWVDFDKPVVFVESVFDLAAVRPLYANVCAPLSVGFGEAKAKRMRQAIEVVTLFDADKGGDKARMRVSRYLPKANITHLVPPDGKDPGDLDAEELYSILHGYVNLKKGVSSEQHANAGA